MLQSILASIVAVVITFWLAQAQEPAFAILLPIIVGGIIIIGTYPRAGYYIAVILFSLGAALPPILPFFSMGKIISIWLIILVILRFVLKTEEDPKISSGLWYLLFLFFGINLLSALLSDFPTVSFDELRKILTNFIVFFLTLYFVRGRAFYKSFPIVVASSITVSSFIANIEYFLGVNYSIPPLTATELYRAEGVMGSTNILAFTGVFALPILFHWLFCLKKFWQKNFMIFCILINIMAVIECYSRSNTIVLAVILCIIGIDKLKSLRARHVTVVIPAILAIVLMIGIFVPAKFWERQKSVTDVVTDTSIGRRLSYVIVGLDTFKNHPILGLGPGTFKVKYALSNYSRQFTDDIEELARAAHNTYLEVLTGSGLLGLFSFCFILLAALYYYKRAIRRLYENGMIEDASLVKAYRNCFLSLCVYFFFASSMSFKYFWIFLAISQIALDAALSSSEMEKSASSYDVK